LSPVIGDEVVGDMHKIDSRAMERLAETVERICDKQEH
jgi:hypothetical protein